MNKALVNTVDTTDGGDSVYQGIVNILAELALIYGHVNTLFKLSAGTSAPSGAGVDDLWVNTSGATPVLQRLASTGPDVWENLGATGAFNSGVGMDDAFAGYRRNMVCARYSSSVLRVAATATLPSTVMISGQMLQNTANTDLSGWSAAGEYQVYAERNGTSANFKLGYAAIGDTLTSGKVKIAEVTYDGDFKFIENTEHFPAQEQAPPGAFLITRDTNQAIAHDTETAIQFATSVNDEYSQFDATTEKTIVIQRTGWWALGASSRVTHTGDKTSMKHIVKIKIKDGATIARGLEEHEDATAVQAIARGDYYLTKGEIVQVTSYQTSSPSGSLNISPADSGNRDVAFWGRYLGK